MSKFANWDLGGCGCPGTCSFKTCVTGCNGTPLPGASVTIGTPTPVSGTTDSGGCVTLDIGSAGSYTLSITKTGMNGYSGSVTMGCGGNITIALTPVAGYHCIDCCPNAIPDTLTGTLTPDGVTCIGGGTVTITWGPDVENGVWSGEVSVTCGGFTNMVPVGFYGDCTMGSGHPDATFTLISCDPFHATAYDPSNGFSYEFTE